MDTIPAAWDVCPWGKKVAAFGKTQNNPTLNPLVGIIKETDNGFDVK